MENIKLLLKITKYIILFGMLLLTLYCLYLDIYNTNMAVRNWVELLVLEFVVQLLISKDNV